MNKVIYFLIFMILNFLLLWHNLRFEMFENGVYYHYLESILYDFDFNIFNQMVSIEDRWLVSQNYNHPDYHSPFVSILLIPAYFFFHFFHYILGPISNPALIPHQVFLTTRIAIFTLIYFMTPIDYRRKILLPSLGIIFFSSLSWHILFDSTEISFLCLLFSFPIFFMLKEILSGKKVNEWAFATSIALFAAIKPDAISWILILAPIVIIKREWKLFFKCAALCIVTLGHYALVNYVRFDTIILPNPAINFFNNSIYYQFFGENGLLFKSPLLLISFLGLFVGLCSKEKVIKEVSLSGILIILIKSLIIGGALPSNTEDIGTRLFVTELPFYSFGLYLLATQFSLKLKTVFILFTPMTILGLYMWLTSLFLNDRDYRIYKWFGLKDFSDGFIYLKEHYLSKQWEFETMGINFLILSLLSSLFILSVVNCSKKYQVNIFRIGIPILAGIIISSLLNFNFNKLNVQKLKNEKLFENTVVAKGPALYYDEVLDLIHYSNLQKNNGIPQKYDLTEYTKSYLQQIRPFILHDPIGFIDDLDRNQIRSSFWQKKFK